MEKYLQELVKYKKDNVFNPWGEFDGLHDKNQDSHKIRFNNLKQYLEQRKNPKFVLIAEALGYNGGHFSGIAMTSERQLLNDNLLLNQQIFEGEKFRSSCPEKLSKLGLTKQAESGFTEPTGSIVWNTLSNLLNTYSWVNWNTYPFHPFKDSMLSNRTPKGVELEDAKFFLSEFLKLYDRDVKIISIGNISESVLSELGREYIKVRHPANGGATKFKNQITEFLKNN